MTSRLSVVRPQTRGDCEPPFGLRPCPYVSCRYHLVGAVEQASGRIEVAGHTLDVDADPRTVAAFVDAVADTLASRRGPSCTLDVAARGERTLQEVGEVVGLTRERVRQIERAGTINLTRAARRSGVR